MRLLYIVSHPIQYQAPLLRRIAAEPGIDLHVLFESGHSLGRFFDPGFGRTIAWDCDVSHGYAWSVLQRADEALRFAGQADAVWLHGWDSRIRLNILAARRRIGRPILMRGENNDVSMPDGIGPRRFVKRRFLNWAFARCDRFLCIGSDNRAYYRQRGIAEQRLFDVPYAVDNGYFRARAAEAAAGRDEFRTALGIAPGRPVVLYAGKLQPRKHPLVLLDAFRRLDRAALGNPVLIYVGEGEQSQALADAAAPLGECVRILGFRNQSELPAFYELADIFVLASSREPWGLAVNEAMNCGTAVITSTECGCAADLITPDTGRVVPPGQAAPLAGALSALLADRPRLETMGRAASRAVEAWDFEADVRGLTAALASL